MPYLNFKKPVEDECNEEEKIEEESEHDVSIRLITDHN